MKQFQFAKTREAGTAVAEAGERRQFIAGGTTLIDLMKLNVMTPEKLVDINALPLDRVETTADGGLKIGALVRNADLANHPYVKTHFAVLSEAILSGATAQLRNMATTGGNLLQRTRCIYFRDLAYACNKREPGSGCAAMDGDNRTLAILGTSDHCIATNPSDMNVALTALEATVHIQGRQGTRSVPIADFHLLPGDTPHIETVLQHGDLITHVTVNPMPAGAASTYLKLRDRASYEFALASAAVIVKIENGTIAHIRLALGGVGTKPWRAVKAEAVLMGSRPSEEVFRKAAEAELAEAKPRAHNKFKVELSKRCIVRTLKVAVSI